MLKKYKKNSYIFGKIFFFFFLFLCLVLVYLNFWIRIPFVAEMKSGEVVGVDSKINISFSQRVFLYNGIDIEIVPSVDFDFEFSKDRKELFIEPNENFDYETKYYVYLNNFFATSGEKLKSKSFFFYTEENEEKSSLIVENEEEDFGKIELSEDRYIPPESSRVTGSFIITPYINEGKYIDVSISNQAMTLFEDGVKINEFLVSTGQYGMPTPIGDFSIIKKETNHWSFSYNLWMPYSMQFYGPYYIHELPYWSNGYREGEEHLGYKVSHGCIRLGVGPAKYVFDWASIGTPLHIHY